jgi:small conductance mechanosensitive channel
MDTTAIKEVVDAAIPMITNFGLRVLGAFAILIVGSIAAKFSARMVRAALGRAKADPTIIGFVGHLAHYGVLAFAIIAALSKFGIETTSFVAIMGAAGLAIGLALQGSLSNFAAGVLVLIFKPFRIGDFIEAGGHMGTVKEITIFTTTLASPDNKKIIIPNSSLTEGSIVNYSANEKRRVDMSAGIGYNDNMGKAKEILVAICEGCPKVLKDPAIQVEVSELGDSSVNFVVRPWALTEDYWDVYFYVTRKIKEEFDQAGVSIPFPQTDVHLHKVAKEKVAKE